MPSAHPRERCLLSWRDLALREILQSVARRGARSSVVRPGFQTARRGKAVRTRRADCLRFGSPSVSSRRHKQSRVHVNKKWLNAAKDNQDVSCEEF